MSELSPWLEPMSADDIEREKIKVNNKMRTKLGLDNPHLIAGVGVPDNLREAAELTYAQVMDRKAIDYSPDLPDGAVPVEDQVSMLAIRKDHIYRIKDYFIGFSEPSPLTELSGFEVRKMPRSPGSALDGPIIEGLDWPHAAQVAIDRNTAVFFYQSGFSPMVEGGAPEPIMYQVGNPDPGVIREIVNEVVQS